MTPRSTDWVQMVSGVMVVGVPWSGAAWWWECHGLGPHGGGSAMVWGPMVVGVPWSGAPWWWECHGLGPHGGGSAMVWGCMSAAGTGGLQFIEGTMNANMYRRAVFQHNDP
ncbi:unnamed protein product, partial [Staurois parvus]